MLWQNDESVVAKKRRKEKVGPCIIIYRTERAAVFYENGENRDLFTEDSQNYCFVC